MTTHHPQSRCNPNPCRFTGPMADGHHRTASYSPRRKHGFLHWPTKATASRGGLTLAVHRGNNAPMHEQAV